MHGHAHAAGALIYPRTCQALHAMPMNLGRLRTQVRKGRLLDQETRIEPSARSMACACTPAWTHAQAQTFMGHEKDASPHRPVREAAHARPHHVLRVCRPDYVGGGYELRQAASLFELPCDASICRTRRRAVFLCHRSVCSCYRTVFLSSRCSCMRRLPWQVCIRPSLLAQRLRCSCSADWRLLHGRLCCCVGWRPLQSRLLTFACCRAGRWHCSCLLLLHCFWRTMVKCRGTCSWISRANLLRRQYLNL